MDERKFTKLLDEIVELVLGNSSVEVETWIDEHGKEQGAEKIVPGPECEPKLMKLLRKYLE